MWFRASSCERCVLRVLCVPSPCLAVVTDSKVVSPPSVYTSISSICHCVFFHTSFAQSVHCFQYRCLGRLLELQTSMVPARVLHCLPLRVGWFLWFQQHSFTVTCFACSVIDVRCVSPGVGGGGGGRVDIGIMFLFSDNYDCIEGGPKLQCVSFRAVSAKVGV